MKKFEKIERAKEILNFNTVKEINEILKEEFGSGLSNTEFANLHKNLVTNELKTTIRKMYDFFIKNKDRIIFNEDDIIMLKKAKEIFA
jgi:hypothetical protein